MKKKNVKKKTFDRIEIKIHIEKLKEKFKKLCEENNTTMTDVLEKEVIRYVQEKG